MEIDFSFIATFLSLFFGLAIMNALGCISSYIQNFKKLENYWLWWIWAFQLMVICCALWFNLFDTWADIKVWKRYYFPFLAFYSAILYLVFDIFFDNFKDLDNKDLKLQYYKNKKSFFLLMTLLFSLKQLGEYFVQSHIIRDESSQAIIPILFTSSMFIILAYTNNKYIQGVLSLIFLFFLVLGAFNIQF